MNREEYIKLCEGKIEHHKKAMENAQEILELTKSQKEINTYELYEGIQKYFELTLDPNGEYLYILGGDGRSAPYDEKRRGLVIEITLNKEYFLTEEQKDIIQDYVQKIHNPKKIRFKC